MRLIRTSTLAATALLASLALTACSNSTDATAKPDDKSASTTTPTQKQPAAAKPAQKDTAGTGTDTTTTTATTKKPENPKSPAEPQKRSTCTSSTIKLTASPVARPVNHVLLTATNTGSTTCDLYYAPATAFSDDAQSPLQIDRDTQPQAVVTLSPGQSGYAMIRTSGEDNGDKPYTTQQIRVHFENRANNGSVGPASYAHLPKPLSVVDSQAAVTYWQSDLDAISAW
ncbi:DUF4232 domain-containing protein [Streptomyces sp. NPDC050738]|uniref:DUF4232 domain-containing protein n=1 Tax=Streptomyces sp. NPDC050738 TaxID=3154744 RepID=UPI003445A9A9